MDDASRQPESGESRTISWIAAVVGSGALSLVVGLVVDAFQIAGVIDMAMAHLLMALAWCVAVISIGIVGVLGFREYKRKFIFISIITVSVVLVGFDYWMIKKRAELNMANAPQGSLQFSKTEISPAYPSIDVGKQFGVNWYFTNPGPGRIFNLLPFYKAYVEEVSKNTDQQVKTRFEKDRVEYLTRKPKGVEVGHEDIWVTIPASPLTQQQYEGVLEGTVRIYFATWFIWTDAQGSEAPPYYRCVWLQGDSYLSAHHVKDLVWHVCAW